MITVRAAFGSRWSIALYVFMIVTLLCLPWVTFIKGWVNPQTRFEHVEGSRYLTEHIFYEKTPIDILFLGNSYVLTGIETSIVQSELTKTLNRPAISRTLAVNWSGKDIVFALLKEVIKRRPVKLIVLQLNDIGDGENVPHMQFPKWWRMGEEPELQSLLGQRESVSIYAGSLITSGLTLLDYFLPKQQRSIESAVLSDNLGHAKVERGFGKPFVLANREANFPAANSILRNWKGEERPELRIVAVKTQPFQNAVVKEIGKLIKSNGLKLAVVSIPRFGRAEFVEEPKDWSVEFGMSVPVIGMSGAVLFDGDRKDEDFFYDSHMNANGSEYFTRAILPGLKEIFLGAI